MAFLRFFEWPWRIHQVFKVRIFPKPLRGMSLQSPLFRATDNQSKQMPTNTKRVSTENWMIVNAENVNLRSNSISEEYKGIVASFTFVYADKQPISANKVRMRMRRWENIRKPRSSSAILILFPQSRIVPISTICDWEFVFMNWGGETERDT